MARCIKTKTEIFAEEENRRFQKIKESTIYFCPYCDALYPKDKGYSYNKKTKKFQCQDCSSKEFTRDAYRSRKQHKYNINGNIDKNFLEKSIEDCIVNFRKEGVSIQTIHDITLFSTSFIREVLDKANIYTNYQIPLQDFKNELLKCARKNLTQFKKFSDREIIIIQAYEYGCTYDFIAELLKMSKNTIRTNIAYIYGSMTEERFKNIKINKCNKYKYYTSNDDSKSVNIQKIKSSQIFSSNFLDEYKSQETDVNK